MEEKEKYIKGTKFGSKHLDQFANNVWIDIEKSLNIPANERIRNNPLEFDLSKLEWISHDVLVYLTSLFRFLYNNEVIFYVKIFDETNLNILNTINQKKKEKIRISKQEKHQYEIAKRKTKQTINLWGKWNIYSFLKPKDDGFYHFEEYFNVDQKRIDNLKIIIRKSNDLKIYNWHKITPFVYYKLNFGIENESKIHYDLNKAFNLQEKAFEILDKYRSQSPFLNKALKSIITKELYENSLDHSYEGIDISSKECYFGISLKNELEINDEVNDDSLLLKNSHSHKEKISYWLESNFKSEAIPKSINFYSFINKNGTREFSNKSYIEFTFLDFGKGIPSSLKNQYLKDISDNKSILDKFGNDHLNRHIDTRILEYSFDYTSSRHPIDEAFENRKSIARGLFSLLDIVKRYNGMLIARSNYGKILYNFSKSKNNKDCIEYFDSSNIFNKGTIITLYLPETKEDIVINSIKPSYVKVNEKRTVDFIRVIDIQKELENTIKLTQSKQALYNLTFSKIDFYLNRNWNKNTLIYIDFAGGELDSRSSKKILYYLASTPKVNSLNQIVIINPISIEIVKAVQEEMISLYQDSDEPFLYNPIPCVFYDNNLFKSYKIIWIGITELAIEKKLIKLFYLDQQDFRKLDFENPNLIEGSFFRFDKYSNLKSELPSISEIEISEVISNNTISSPDEQYLTAGNYYQTRYISLLEPLQDEEIGKFIATHLINLFSKSFNDFTKLLSVTLSSNVLGRCLLNRLSELDIESSLEHIYLSNYHSYNEERKFKQISNADKVIIVTDVISTGKLILDIVNRLKNLRIEEKDICVLTITDNRKSKFDENYEIPSIIEELKQIKIYSILKIELTKYRSRLKGKIVRRINPITNSINSLSVEKSEINQVLFPNPIDFLSKIDKNYFRIGNIKHDKNTHPYFIDTFGLFSSENGHVLLKELLQIIDSRERERIVKEKTEKEESVINAIKYRLEQISNTTNKKHINKIHRELKSIENLHFEKEIPLDTFNPDYIFYPYYSGIECIDDSYLLNEVYPHYKTKIFQLPRFEGDRQWMFSTPPKFLNSKTQNKNILIIDDGSSTGETIIQMVDEICFLDVKKIVVLSIIGKLDDYKREFLSRVKEIKVKKLDGNDLSKIGIFDEHIVPIHFYLATNLHIPVYSHYNENIFIKELNTLRRFKQVSNLPFRVLSYINYRISELTSDVKRQVPEHFHKSINLLRIFELRDAIGKIDGYKFYKEYFDFFDDLISSVNTQNDYGSIEDIISIIIHERRLLNTIKNLLPDLYAILNDYIDEIISKKRNTIRLSEYSSLRFYFIINYYEYFETITEKSIFTILNFLKDCKYFYPFDFFIYVLYSSFGFGTKDVFNAIEGILNSKSIQKKYYSGLKSLYNYYRINNYSDGGSDSSDALRSIYTYEMDKENHQKTLSTYLANFRNKLLAYTTGSVSEKYQRLLEAKDFWEHNIFERLINIIYHAKKIGSILESYNDSKLANIVYNHKDYNAEKVFYAIDDLLTFDENTLPSADSINEIRNSIDKLLIKRITKTGENPLCNFAISYKRINYFDLWNEIHSSSSYNLVEKTTDEFNNRYCTIKIHECIITEIIFDEIIENLRLSNDTVEIQYLWKVIHNKAILRIENNVDKEKELEKSGRLNGLSDMKKISLNYDIEVEHSDFLDGSDLFYVQLKFPYNINKKPIK